MPIFTLIDDMIFDGSEDEFKRLVLSASLYAVLVLDIDAELSGDPPAYLPVNPSPYTWSLFQAEYRRAFEMIEAALALVEADNLSAANDSD